MSEEKANITVAKHVDGLKPIEIASDAKVQKKFIELYNTVHGSEMGAALYAKERFNFEKLLQENPALQECTKLSLYGCFLDISVSGLSLDPNKPLCYIIPRSCKSGLKDDKGKDIYEKRASLTITGPGELVLRKRAGQINYADNPVVIYEGDEFQPTLDEKGSKVIHYKPSVPRKSNKIIGSFIRIVRNDGSTDYQWLLENDIERLKGYSSKANSYWDAKQNKRVSGDANALYTSLNGGIDSGFLENKMIKHAFDAYPKVRTGQFTQLESHIEPEINYGIEETIETTAQDVTNEPESGAFGGAQEPAQQGSIIINESDEGAF